MIATFKRDHSQIEAIIRHNIEQTGASVLRLHLCGFPNENNLDLCADLTVRTRQGDEAFLMLDHEQICFWINDRLMAEGYEQLARPHLFQGSKQEESGNNARTNIVCNIYYELRAQ